MSRVEAECPWCFKPVRVNASGRFVPHVAITDRCPGSGASLAEVERNRRPYDSGRASGPEGRDS